jgi:hypothetical protein
LAYSYPALIRTCQTHVCRDISLAASFWNTSGPSSNKAKHPALQLWAGLFQPEWHPLGDAVAANGMVAPALRPSSVRQGAEQHVPRMVVASDWLNWLWRHRGISSVTSRLLHGETCRNGSWFNLVRPGMYILTPKIHAVLLGYKARRGAGFLPLRASGGFDCHFDGFRLGLTRRLRYTL